MYKFFFKLFLLIAVLVVSGTNSFAQYEWTKYPSNPLNMHGAPGSWDESVVTPCVIFNSDLNRYEMWYGTFDGTYPNNGIGFAWSTDGITWTKHPSAVMTPSGTGWEAVSVGECSVIKEGNVYKMWYTGHPNATRTPSYIGYATSTDGGITWQKYAGNPVLSPGTGWESARVEFPSVIKVTGGYWMFYTGELAHSIARTGRAFSTDGINWQKDTVNNPVLLPGDPGEWDQNNYLGNVIELNNTLYIYYTANPGVGGTAIGGAVSTDMGITWSKFQNNPIILQGTTGQWDDGWIETGCAVFAHNELRLYYDGGSPSTGWLGRIGLATSTISNWQMQNSNFPANVMVKDFSAANSQVCWAIGSNINGTPYGGYSRTTDGGNNWVCDTIGNNWDGYLYQIYAMDANTAYIVSQSGSTKGIYKTTDGGSTWNRQNAYNTSLYGPGYIHFFDSQNGVVIGDPDFETYTTTNGGQIWNPVTMPPPISGEWGCWNSGNGITAAGDNAWFSTGARVFKSTDKGYTWNVILTEPQYSSYWPCIKFQDSQTGIYSLKLQGDLTHIYRKTTDGGVTWNTLSNSILDNLAPTGMQHIPGTSATYVVSGGMPQGMNGLAVTYDAGESWTLIDSVGHNFVEFPTDAVGWGSDYSTNSVQKYVGPRIISSVEEEIVDLVPTGYSLSQNYPNPFNPSTTFRYSIPQTSKVVIKVYDILGNEIALLMDEEKSVGTYEITWNASQLPSGVYFYQLKATPNGGQAGGYLETKKMMLLK